MSKVSIKTEIIQTKRITPKIETVRAGSDKKKILGSKRLVRQATIKNVNPATKTDTTSSRIMCGHIQERRVRCGKPNCKCANGEPHRAYYHVWYSDGIRYQKYVRRSQVEQVRRACQTYRELQIKLRFGRVEHKQLLARARELFRRLSG